MKKIKLTQIQLDKIKLYWAMLKQEEIDFYQRVYLLEKQMSEATGIEDLEFFECDGFCGVGNLSRTLRLIPEDELDKK